MSKKLLFSLLIASSSAHALSCGGKFPNIISDICWSCIFPMRIAGAKLNPSSNSSNGDSAPPVLCQCKAPPRFGVGISYWEPARIAEVVRTPFCSPTLGGTVLAKINNPHGTHWDRSGQSGRAFYHVHWVNFPVFNWLGVALSSACLTPETFDVGYMSELDLLWDSDSASMAFNPEAFLFSNLGAQAACAADAIKAQATGFGIDSLYWCSGSQGSLFPISGNHAGHIGGVDSSLATVHKLLFKLHRTGLARDTSTAAAICEPQVQRTLRKKQYKQQMLYPVAQTRKGYGLGAPSLIWGSGREFPYKGEDFSYMVWRKRSCCAF